MAGSAICHSGLRLHETIRSLCPRHSVSRSAVTRHGVRQFHSFRSDCPGTSQSGIGRSRRGDHDEDRAPFLCQLWSPSSAGVPVTLLAGNWTRTWRIFFALPAAARRRRVLFRSDGSLGSRDLTLCGLVGCRLRSGRTLRRILLSGAMYCIPCRVEWDFGEPLYCRRRGLVQFTWETPPTPGTSLCQPRPSGCCTA